MTRLIPLDVEDMSEAQRRVFETIRSGPRGRFGGPFPALLHCPEIADRVQTLGECLRFESDLAAPLRELAVLAVARYWRCTVEWNAHVIIAQRDGVDRALIKALVEGGIPKSTSRQERLVLEFCQELNEKQFVSDATYQQTVEVLGADGVVELVVILGYYTLLSMILNTFETKPEGPDAEIPADLRLCD